MYFFLEKFGIPLGGLIGAATIFLRYAFMAGVAFFVFYALSGYVLALIRVLRRKHLQADQG